MIHNDKTSHTFVQFISKNQMNKTHSDPSTPSPSVEDAQHALSMLYKGFFTIMLAPNRNWVFVPCGKVRRFEVGQLEAIHSRMLMDPVMFYIAVAIL